MKPYQLGGGYVAEQTHPFSWMYYLTCPNGTELKTHSVWEDHARNERYPDLGIAFFDISVKKSDKAYAEQLARTNVPTLFVLQRAVNYWSEPRRILERLAVIEAIPTGRIAESYGQASSSIPQTIHFYWVELKFIRVVAATANSGYAVDTVAA